MSWWDTMKWVLDVLGPIYSILRFADSQKLGSLCGFMSRMMHARHDLSADFPEESLDKNKYLEVVDRRVEQLYNNTLMVAGICCCHLVLNISVFVAAILF
jgi:hypothetical protein